MNWKRFLCIAYFSTLAGWSGSCSTRLDSAVNRATQIPLSTRTSQPAHSKILKSPTPSTLSYQIKTYRSQVFGRDRTYGIALPPGYDNHPHTRYPVVFLLHGGHGDPSTWFIKGKALEVIENLYASGKLPPSIIVTPDGNDLRESSALWDPEYVNGQYGNVLSAIGDELVEEIKAHYQTLPDPRFWAIGGLSSGGWGALNIGLHYPQNFKLLFSHSGYFSDKSGRENSPIEFVKTLDSQTRHSLAIYLDAGEGEGDRRYLAQSQDFHQVLTQVEVQNKFNHFPGGHGAKKQEVKNFWQRNYQQLVNRLTGETVKQPNVSWNFWHQHLADSLSYVGERFRAAEQHPSLSNQQ